MRKVVLAGLLAASLAAPALAQVTVGISIGPPAPLVERVPAPRAGWVWAPGYWVSWGNRCICWRGYWMPARPGWRWHPGWWARA
jgi:hypothetical protein